MLGLAVHPKTGDFFVANSPDHQILRLDREGKLLRTYGSKAKGPDQLKALCGVALDVKKGLLYALDDKQDLVLQFDIETGEVLRTWGGTGEGPDQLKLGGVANLSVDDASRVYVADTQNRRVQVFDSEGNLLDSLQPGDDGPGSLRAVDVAVRGDRVYVLANNQIHIFERRFKDPSEAAAAPAE